MTAVIVRDHECIVVPTPKVEGCLRIIVQKDGHSVWHEFELKDSIVVALPGHPVAETSVPKATYSVVLDPLRFNTRIL